ALKSAAHSLRGSSTTMGATRLGVLCTAVEAQAAAPSPALEAAALITVLITELDREFVNVRAALLAEREGAGRA
ncbi:MAG: Hpt domain-containing protein, partial [Acidobacteriota bacterium]